MLCVHGSNNLLQSTPHQLSEGLFRHKDSWRESRKAANAEQKQECFKDIKYPTICTSPNSALELNNYSRANKST